MSNKKNSKALATTNNTTAPIYQLDESGTSLEGFKNLQVPIVKPAEMPTGAFIVGEVLSIEVLDMKTFKSSLLHMVDAQDREFRFPITAVIKRNLQPNPEAFVGKTLLIKKTGEKIGDKGKKATHLFDVAVRD